MSIVYSINMLNHYLLTKNYDDLTEGLNYNTWTSLSVKPSSTSTQEVLDAIKEDLGMVDASVSTVSSYDEFCHGSKNGTCSVCKECNEGLGRLDRKGGYGCDILSIFRLHGPSSLIESDREVVAIVKVTTRFYVSDCTFAITISHDIKEQVILNKLNELTENRKNKPDDTQVDWKFLYMTKSGLNSRQNNAKCPSWDSIKENYEQEVVAEQIDRLVNLEKPYEKGKLVFWHGEPGTGKTYAIRALAKEWKAARFSYVTQPVKILNDFGGLYQFLIEECVIEDDQVNRAVIDGADGTPFTVLVIEDALDLLLEETRQKDSGTISRLLNLTEGIVGQGLRLLVLITSNEPVKTIDPAFLRPGRSLHNLEFKRLTEEQSAKWLKNKGVEVDRIENRPHTLAELYQYLNDSLLVKGKESRLGFTV